jgi:hypothetical protein
MSILRTTVAVLFACAVATAQIPPDLFHYPFNEGSGSTTANLAVPGVGTNPSPIVGHTLVPAPAGQFMDGCMLGGGGNGVDTGWPMAFGAGDWTISFWLDMSGAASTTSLVYFFGDPVGGSFRSFTNGVAGTGVILRGGGVMDTLVPGGAIGGPHVITFVYDSAAAQTRGYLDGVLVATTSQPALSLSSAMTFRVGGQLTGLSGLPVGARMDEFRAWSTALTTSEVAASWNTPIGGGNPASVIPVGSGCVGTGGLAPVLSTALLPTIGNAAFSVDVTQAATGSVSYLFFSVGLGALPIPLGGGCALYLDQPTLLLFYNVGLSPIGPLPTGGTGSATFALPVPPDPSLAGVAIGLQAAVADAAALPGFTVTNALLALIN